MGVWPGGGRVRGRGRGGTMMRSGEMLREVAIGMEMVMLPARIKAEMVPRELGGLG